MQVIGSGVDNSSAATRHFGSLLEQYHNVVAINLVNQKGSGNGRARLAGRARARLGRQGREGKGTAGQARQGKGRARQAGHWIE